MFFYLIVLWPGLDKIKLGLTRRLPKFRYKEYLTSNPKCKFHSIAYFPNYDENELFALETNCLVATKDYSDDLDILPNCEVRYGDPKELWSICGTYFPNDAIIYTDHNQILNLTSNDCPNVLETELVQRDHFSSIEELLYKPKTLRGYQPEAYKSMKEILKKSSTCLLSIMCRCGKTELFKNYAWEKANEFNYIIYVAPRLDLIGDMIGRFTNMLPKHKYVDISSAKSDLTISDEVLSNLVELETKLMIFTCNESFKRLEPIFNNIKFKLLIFDEAHYLAGVKRNDHPLVILRDKWCEYYKGKVETIFATATPEYGNYITYTNTIYMNDSNYFCDITSDVVSFNDIEAAIEQKFMTKAVLVVGEVKDLSDYESEIEESNLTKKRVQKAISLFNDTNNSSFRNKTLFYCNKRDSVNFCFEQLKTKFPNYKIFRMIYGMDRKEINESRETFKSCKTPCILVNCQMVTAGINIEDLDTVVIVDPKTSKADIVQIIMRPRSYDLNNPDKIAYIIIPQTCDTDNFETVITVIENLHRNNDPTVTKFVNACKKISKRQKDKDKPIVKIDDIKIDENIKHKIIELTRESLNSKNTTLENAIKKLLSDDIPRTTTQIHKELNNVDFTEKDCETECIRLIGCKELLCNTDKPVKFYLSKSKTSKLSLKEFIEYLKLSGIETETDYRERFSAGYSDEIPVNPEEVYTKFSWSMLTEQLVSYNTKEDCIEAIDKLLKDSILHDKIKSTVSVATRLDYLRKLDNKIPTYLDIKKIYNVEPGDLHKILMVRNAGRLRPGLKYT